MRMILIRLIAALFMLFGAAGAAHAGCAATSKTLNYTDSSSYSVLSGTVPQVSGQAGMDCSGALLTLLGGTYARATMNSPTGWLLTGPGGATIPYQLSADSGGTVVFTNSNSVDYMSGTILNLLGLLGPTNFTAPIYTKLIASPNIPAGTYTDTVNVTWNYHVCNGAQVAGICVLYEDGVNIQRTITVKIIVQSDCRIVAPNVNFGSAPLASQFSAVNQAVMVNCTKDSTYKVGFTNGQNSTAHPWRVMKDTTNTYSLQYNIYRTDGVTIWDQSNPLTSSQTGTGTTTANQAQNYVAKINPAQQTPPAGTYSDSVSVEITF